MVFKNYFRNFCYNFYKRKIQWYLNWTCGLKIKQDIDSIINWTFLFRHPLHMIKFKSHFSLHYSYSHLFGVLADVHIYRYGHINVSTFHYPYQTHTSGGPIWINFFFPERYCKNLWDDCFGFFDFCVLWRLGPKTVFLGPLA